MKKRIKVCKEAVEFAENIHGLPFIRMAITNNKKNLNVIRLTYLIFASFDQKRKKLYFWGIAKYQILSCPGFNVGLNDTLGFIILC